MSRNGDIEGPDFNRMDDVVLTEVRDPATFRLLGIKAITLNAEVASDGLSDDQVES